MTKSFTELLFNTNIDLSQSLLIKDDPLQFVIKTRLSAARIGLSLLFGLPCLFLLGQALDHQGVYLFFVLVFCPPLALLAVLFGMVVQIKTFVPNLGQAIKSFQLFNLKRDITTTLPKEGVILTYKKWSSGRRGGCYFYYAEFKDLNGFRFSVARDQKRRDEFAKDIAQFLNYTIQNSDESVDPSTH